MLAELLRDPTEAGRFLCPDGLVRPELTKWRDGASERTRFLNGCCKSHNKITLRRSQNLTIPQNPFALNFTAKVPLCGGIRVRDGRPPRRNRSIDEEPGAQRYPGLYFVPESRRRRGFGLDAKLVTFRSRLPPVL